MRLEIRTILFPIRLTLPIWIAFSKFIVSTRGTTLGIFFFLVILGALVGFLQSEILIVIEVLIIVFLISPYGLPKIVIWIICILKLEEIGNIIL